MTLTIKKVLHRPTRVLIHGPSFSGKTWFAQRLATWLHLVQEMDPISIEEGDGSPDRRVPIGAQCTILITNADLTRSQLRAYAMHYDWIFDFTQRPASSTTVTPGDGAAASVTTHQCPQCGGTGQYVSTRKEIGKAKRYLLPCHGRDCIMQVPLIGLAHKEIPKPSKLDQMRQHRIDSAEGSKQVSALRLSVIPDINHDEHIPSIIVSDLDFSLTRIGEHFDTLLTAIRTGAALNDCAKGQLRTSVAFDFQRLRSQLCGLKALIHQDAETHRILRPRPTAKDAAPF